MRKSQLSYLLHTLFCIAQGKQAAVTETFESHDDSKRAREKRPSSDLPYEFFSQFWKVIGPELLAVLQEAFLGGGGTDIHYTKQRYQPQRNVMSTAYH